MGECQWKWQILGTKRWYSSPRLKWDQNKCQIHFRQEISSLIKLQLLRHFKFCGTWSRFKEWVVSDLNKKNSFLLFMQQEVCDPPFVQRYIYSYIYHLLKYTVGTFKCHQSKVGDMKLGIEIVQCWRLVVKKQSIGQLETLTWWSILWGPWTFFHNVALILYIF